MASNRFSGGPAVPISMIKYIVNTLRALLQVPATPDEALRTSLMGMFEKRRFRNFLMYLASYREDEPGTYQGELVACPSGGR